ncbi:MAG: hypothetical protein JO053_16180 [Acidobacteria bacterium]|nr:hypothetical protein [Acidobacteriota bacterium]
MKQRLFKLALFFSFILGGLALTAFAQGGQIVGGYGSVDVHDKNVRKAANVAIKQRSARTGRKLTLVKINKAEGQVVAGENYRMCMDVRDGRGRIRTVTAVVWERIRKPMLLTNWANGCKEL